MIAKWGGRSVLSLRKFLMASAGSRPSAQPNSILAVPGISEAIRPVFFQTDLDDFLYATHGGTLFLISFQGCSYALTCRHVFQDFPKGRLFITQEKQAQKGSKPAPVEGVVYPSSPRDGAVGTDIEDICLVEFAEDIPKDFFKGSEFVIDDGTVATAQEGHELFIPGVLKDKTVFDPPDIRMGYCQLRLRDVKPATSDPILRTAYGEFGNDEIGSVVGVSGAPVFDVTANRLCGMVVRGGMQGRRCTLQYIDIFDIMRLLEGVGARAKKTYYIKHVAADRLRRPAAESES